VGNIMGKGLGGNLRSLFTYRAGVFPAARLEWAILDRPRLVSGAPPSRQPLARIPTTTRLHDLDVLTRLGYQDLYHKLSAACPGGLGVSSSSNSSSNSNNNQRAPSRIGYRTGR
jgi:hypothetical protein